MIEMWIAIGIMIGIMGAELTHRMIGCSVYAKPEAELSKKG